MNAEPITRWDYTQPYNAQPMLDEKAKKEEVRSTSATGGEKGTKEARYDLIPVEALEKVAILYGRGASKYEDHNWRKGYEWSKSYAALQRHANAFWRGEDLDEEMGLPHLASVVFHALTMMTFMDEQESYDDRFIQTEIPMEVLPFGTNLDTLTKSGIYKMEKASPGGEDLVNMLKEDSALDEEECIARSSAMRRHPAGKLRLVQDDEGNSIAGTEDAEADWVLGKDDEGNYVMGND